MANVHYNFTFQQFTKWLSYTCQSSINVTLFIDVLGSVVANSWKIEVEKMLLIFFFWRKHWLMYIMYNSNALLNKLSSKGLKKGHYHCQANIYMVLFVWQAFDLNYCNILTCFFLPLTIHWTGTTLSLFNSWENRGVGWLENLSKVTGLLQRRPGISSQAAYFQRLFS